MLLSVCVCVYEVVSKMRRGLTMSPHPITWYECVFVCLSICGVCVYICAVCVGECVFLYVGINVYVGMRFCITTPTYTCAILLSVP